MFSSDRLHTSWKRKLWASEFHLAAKDLLVKYDNLLTLMTSDNSTRTEHTKHMISTALGTTFPKLINAMHRNGYQYFGLSLSFFLFFSFCLSFFFFFGAFVLLQGAEYCLTLEMILESPLRLQA
uniref:Uncharacterized protein n=1 Tax=Opuntia streptacantha TaxID=393608 RepID=A0A7C9A4H9_OPUST